MTIVKSGRINDHCRHPNGGSVTSSGESESKIRAPVIIVLCFGMGRFMLEPRRAGRPHVRERASTAGPPSAGQGSARWPLSRCIGHAQSCEEGQRPGEPRATYPGGPLGRRRHHRTGGRRRPTVPDRSPETGRRAVLRTVLLTGGHPTTLPGRALQNDLAGESATHAAHHSRWLTSAEDAQAAITRCRPAGSAVGRKVGAMAGLASLSHTARTRTFPDRCEGAEPEQLPAHHRPHMSTAPVPAERGLRSGGVTGPHRTATTACLPK